MKVLLHDIPQGHSSRERSVRPGPLDLDEWLRALGPVLVVLETDRRGDQITIRGRAELEAEYECARCTLPFQVSLETEFIVFADRRGTDEPRDERALEQEGAVLYHEGTEIDLSGPLREALILEVPQVTLCRTTCKGLCPHCGQDWNLASCACTTSADDPRWEALKSLKEEDV